MRFVCFLDRYLRWVLHKNTLKFIKNNVFDDTCLRWFQYFSIFLKMEIPISPEICSTDRHQKSIFRVCKKCKKHKTLYRSTSKHVCFSVFHVFCVFLIFLSILLLGISFKKSRFKLSMFSVSQKSVKCKKPLDKRTKNMKF